MLQKKQHQIKQKKSLKIEKKIHQKNCIKTKFFNINSQTFPCPSIAYFSHIFQHTLKLHNNVQLRQWHKILNYQFDCFGFTLFYYSFYFMIHVI